MNFDPANAVPEPTFDPTNAVPDDGPPVKEVLRQAAKVKPDTAAEVVRLAKRYPVPREVIQRNFDDWQLHAYAEDADNKVAGSPKLAGAMRKDPLLAELAHDDIEPLAKIESGFAKTAAASAAQAVLGISEGIWRTPDAAQRAVGYLASTVERTGLPQYLNPIRGVQDVLQLLSEGRLPVGPKLFAGTDDVANKISDAQKTLTDRQTFGDAFADVQTMAQNADKALAAAVQTGDLQQLGQVITDPSYWAAFLSQAAPSLYAAMKSGGSVAFMGWLEGMEQASNAAEFEQKTGQKISDADFTQAFAQTALVNSLLEKFGLDKVLGAKGNGLMGLAKAMAGEGGTEALQQINSNLAALFAYNDEQSISEGVLASLMGGVGSGGALSATQQAAERVQQMTDRQGQEKRAATEGAKLLAEQMKLAGGALLRERSPEQFRALMADMTNDGSIHVDAQVLNQLPPEVLNQLPESVRSQIADEAAKNGTVEIPMADVLTVAPGTPLEQVLNDHARMDPFAPSLADTKAAAEKAGELLKQEAQRVIQQASDQEAMQASADAVKANILGQLQATGRFREAVNEGYATWASAFYTAYGSRMGMSPEQFYQRYPLRILGAPSTAPSAGQGEVMDQGEVTVAGLTREQFLGNPKITKNSNAGDLAPKVLNSVAPAEATPFMGGKYTVKMAEDGAAVFDGEKVIASYNFGDTLVVDKKYRKQGIGEELVYQWRKANPGAAKATTRTKASQAIQEKVWERLAAEQIKSATGNLDQPGSTKFDAWFGDSKVVDAEGKPLVVYHGTGAEFDVFKTEGGTGKTSGTGAFFSASTATANSYATGEARNVMPVYISLKTPLVVDAGGANWNRIGQKARVEMPEITAAAATAQEDENLLAELEGRAPETVKPSKRKAKKTNVRELFKGEWDYPDDTASTDDIARWARTQGFDGVIFRNVMDRGPSGMFDYEAAQTPADLYVAFRPEQIKSATGNNGNFDPQNPSILEQSGDGFERFVGDATRVDLGDAHEFKAGEPVVVAALHGTTGDFTAFDQSMANIESDLGGGFYFTNNPADVGENYAGTGPDLTNKIQGEAERLESNDDLDPDEAMKIARDKWMANEGLTMPVWVKMRNPVVLGGSRETFLSYEESYDEETDEYGEPTGDLIAVIEALREVASDERYGDADIEQTIGELMEKAMDNGGLSARELIATAKLSEGLVYATDYESDGKLAPQEILRRAFEAAGFDGFIDQTVDEKFGSQSEGQRKYGKGMKGMDESTVHFIAFTPTQIKSRLGNNGNFDETDPDILKQQARGTFNPRSLELVLNPNANLSTFFHETGHFFLEAMADIASQPNPPAQIAEDMATFLKWAGITGDETVGGVDSGAPLAQRVTRADKLVAWFGTGNTMTNEDGTPRVLYHGTTKAGARGVKAGQFRRSKTGAMGPAVYLGDSAEASAGYDDGAMLRVYARGKYLSNAQWSEYVNAHGWKGAEAAATADGWAGVYDEAFENAVAVWNPENIKSVDAKQFADDGTLLGQDGPQATSTQPLPKGRTPLEVWRSMTLDQQRPYHERWAESIEQYVMEGKAPSVELQPLMRRFSAWLKSVYGSIKQFLAQRGVPVGGGDALNQSAYHGTPHRGIDKFSTDAIGTGEGAQAYGWGLYFASKREIAEWYREKLSKPRKKDPITFDGVKLTPASMRKAGEQYRKLQNEGKWNTPEYAEAVIKAKWLDQYTSFKEARGALARQRQLEAEGKNSSGGVFPVNTAYWDNLLAWMDANEARLGFPARGQLYEVDIPEDSEMLLWDKPLSEQPEKVRKATAEALQVTKNPDPAYSDEKWLIGFNADGYAQSVSAYATKRDAMSALSSMTGRQLYVALEPSLGPRGASMFLAERGIKGIKYLDGTSRGAGDGSYNYVVFSGDDVQIRNQFYQNGPPQPGPALQLNDDIRRVMDRMLATDEQIAQANEVAGLVPDENADALANERLRKRSIADLKWSVKARDKAIAALRKQAASIEKGIREAVTAEVNQMPEVLAKEMLAKTRKENGGGLNDTERAIIADAFSYESVDAMLKAIDAFGSKNDVIDGMTEQRMLEEHGDLIDERAIQEAANEAVHNEARARSLATELRTQAEMLGARSDTGQTNAKGSKITVNALVEAAKQFAANVVSKTALRDLKARAWQHTAAERRAAKRWTEATAAGKTEEAVKAKQDQMLNHAAAKAAIDAKNEAQKILDFFRRVAKGNNETVVEKGRDPDIVNAARAVLAAYGVETPTTKAAAEYLDTLKTNDPDTFSAVEPMMVEAMQNAQPLDALTFDQLLGLHEQVEAMWHLAKRSRQMEVDGDLMDVEDVADEVYAKLEEIGIPDTIPGESGAVTDREQNVRRLQFARALLRRVEQWAEGLDGKFGGPLLRYIFQPVKDAGDHYRTDRLRYRKKFQALVGNVAPLMTHQLIAAPELGYTFGKGHNGIGHAELLHAILHTGNESNKRKLLLGRGWASENADGTLDTSRWDALIKRLSESGVLSPAHYDFAQGVWDLLEETKPLAQKTHRDVFGRYFAEVTADAFVDPFGVTRSGGYVPAQADPEIVADADIRALAEMENESMAYSFPSPGKGFTKSRVEYNRPLKLDLRTIPQHIDKVLLFSHMTPAVRGVAKLLRQKKVSQPLGRIDPAAYSGMLLPWLNRSARQQVETPIVGDGRIAKVLTAIRNRAGAALMFANISNTIQQITGLSGAAIKVRPALLVKSAAAFISAPRQTAAAVAAASPYMADRMTNEVAAMNDEMEKILLNPSAYERAQSWTRRHAYFLQSAFDNTLSPIVWTGAYNQALEDGLDPRMAVRFADGVVRQTQGTTLPEDVSRIESGPPYARVFTQFVSYFNMMANTNGTALQQIAREVGLKKGAGKALYVVAMGMLVPLWTAEAIAQAFRGGPDDEDDDGYLDDWLAAVFGMGTIKGVLAQVPFIGQLANAGLNRLNNNPADDKVSLSPAVSLLEASVGAPVSVYKAIVEDGNQQKAIRDVASLVSIATGLPATAVARPLGYAAGVAQGKIEPTGPVDAARGLVTGVASPASK